VTSRHSDHADIHVVEKSRPGLLWRILSPFENARLHKFGEVAGEFDSVVAGEFRLILNGGGEAVHNAAAEAQPVLVNVLDLFLAAIALRHDVPPADLAYGSWCRCSELDADEPSEDRRR
jgi:hypothetical protein